MGNTGKCNTLRQCIEGGEWDKQQQQILSHPHGTQTPAESTRHFLSSSASPPLSSWLHALKTHLASADFCQFPYCQCFLLVTVEAIFQRGDIW